MEEVKVTARPNKFPWREGIEYDVVPGTPQYGDVVRIRVNGTERFEVKINPADIPYTPQPRVLSKTAFQDYVVSKLGGGATGMGRFTDVMDATRDSAASAVRFAFARYEAAITFEKANTAILTAIMAADSTAGHLTTDERTAILDGWPAQ